MTEKQRKQKLQQIVKELRSGDTKKVSKAIKALEANGDASVIKVLADLLLEGTVSEKNQGEMMELFASLKDTSIVVEMMDVLDEPKYLPIRQTMLSAIWNMKIDFSNYIESFVEIATKGSFMEALDCLTIIENLEGPFMEEDILECQLHLKNFLESGEKPDEQKAHILSEIALKIKDINQSLMD